MKHAERSRSAAVFALSLSLLSIAVLGGLIVQSHRAQSARASVAGREASAPAPVPAAPPEAEPPPQTVVPALGRADLIAAARDAASVHAAGPEAKPQASPLVGRRFQIRLPFGCDGPASDGAAPAEPAYWTYSPDGGSIRIVVRLVDWSGSQFVRDLGENRFEAVEGFWVSRPWTDSEACPATGRVPAATAPAASRETLGLAGFFASGSSRAPRRRERRFETVVKIEADAPPPENFRLRLEGRVTGFPDGQAFACWSESPDQRPACIANVDLDAVSIENPADGAVLRTWETGASASLQ